MTGTNRDRDWTSGPAKWAAVAILGAASVTGVAWSIAADVGAPAHLTRGDKEIGVNAPADEVAYTIDINSAGAAELELLPRIGPALAARIVEDREFNGSFADLDELERVHGIGPKTVDQLRPYAQAK